MELRRSHRTADLAFVAIAVPYAVGCLAVLAQGLLAVVASRSPGLHEALHITGLGTGLWARVALRAAEASHTVPSAPQIVLNKLAPASYWQSKTLCPQS
jgi:hypothetical protein